MNLSRLFIERPIMTVLVCFAIVLFGTVAFRALPVAALPSVDYPTIQVTAALPGASPETMASTVATPLEREFSTIAGISSMSSTNSQGSTSITVQFSLDRNIDAAAQDIQAHISAAGGRLPASMPRPPSYQKVNPAEQPVLYLALSSNTLPLYKTTEYADIQMSQRISMVTGVSRVQVFGEQKYAVRVQVDPDKLASFNVGIDEVQKVIGSANTNLPTGQLNGPTQAFTIESNGALLKAANYRPIIVAYRNGVPIRLEQVANVVDSVENNKLSAWYNNTHGVVLAINKQPGTNTVDVVDNVRALLPDFRRELPPAVDLSVAFDASQSIRASIHDVEFTLLLTVCIVIMVIFLFLRNISATLIPGAAVPFSIIGTFAVMYLLGYSLNNLSLMALTLSVGFVVDDAIVMLENIVRHMEMGKSRMEAALAASREIGFTIISMTISLVAVFIPVLFMSGIVGRLLHEFSVTIVVAILISGFVSLTLTPMLGSRFLKSEHEVKHGAGYRFLEGGFNRLASWYEATLRIALRFGPVTLGIAVLMLGGTVYLYETMPKGFIPSQDAGAMFGAVLGPQDASFDYMAAHVKQIKDIVQQDPAVQDTLAFVQGGNQSFVFAHLKPRDQRALSVDQVIESLRPKFAAVPGVMTFMQNPPPITVSGQFGAALYSLVLQSTDLDELYAWSPKLLAAVRQLPGFVDVNSDQQISAPQVMVDIERDRAQALGINPQQVQDALYSAYGTRQVSVIYAPADQYSVIMEIDPKYQNTPDSLSKLYVRSSNGALVPLDAVVRMKRQTGPLNINHFGQLPAVNISFNLRPGFALGQATQQVDNAIRELRMPATISTSFQGTAKEFENSQRNLPILLVVAILVIYIVLGVLYESFIHPITILSGLPSAVFGALLTLVLFHKELDLYAFVGIIMLFGVVKKNAIMMVDFAVDARNRGATAQEAIWQGCLLRFRPIMMTTVAALFGTLPIALGYGEGADARQPLGLAVVGGLVVSQFLTLYITPVIYLYLEKLQEAMSRRKPVPQPAYSSTLR
ncbi:MAG TPA: efflux RND transporter permease subunit [Candidatus Sulfopaludibacter sp.]|jgi:HAE1 family hydrophobic/amphiphilic exporter-1|nr:efflux RND transporter permease subunit [Candidatus Sulfopaludibacter sp.]